MLPALSNPPSRCERTAAHLVYENLSVNPVVARLRKLTIMQMWRVRCSLVKRTNWRSATLPLGIAVLLASGPSETSPLGIGLLLGVFLGAVFPKIRSGLLFLGAQLPAHLESSGEPEQGVHAANHEGHQEQSGHAPEGIEEERVLSRIVMGGVGQVSGKAAGCARMGFPAGGRDLSPAKGRARVRYRHHIMGSMAVIALGRFGVPELRDLPVIGFKIGLGNLLVAASACSHHVQPEAVLIGAVNGMSGMAIIAHWKWLAEAAHALGMDAVLELVLDAVVAPAARVRHVVGVDTRRRIGAGKDLMSGVATGAGRRHRQAVLQ